MIGPHASEHEIAQMGERIKAHPERWIAQDVVRLSHRPYRFSRRDAAPMPCRSASVCRFWRKHRDRSGGLTRVALEDGSMIVNSSRGGGSKDTWVLEDGDDADRAGPPIADTQPPALPDLRYGAWMGQQQQQQQESPQQQQQS